MKKQTNTRLRLVLTKETIRVLDRKQLTVAAGGSGGGDKTETLSGCPACGIP
jgi:hypothetical protein